MRPAFRREARRRQRRRHKRINALLALVVLAGSVVAVHPLFDNTLAEAQAYRVISSLSDETDRTYEQGRTRLLAQAQAYNLDLGGEGAHTDNEHMGGSNGQEGDILDLSGEVAHGEILGYEEQLREDDTATLCWVEAERIGLRQLVYHGTSDEVLATGAGHLAWSSLPVGGTASHCVIAAHSGMQRSEMFDELDKLEVGDRFYLHTLGDSYCYRIYQIEMVLPEEAQSHCQIEPTKDLCTLMTCTPYGVNTHRLLVHGIRCAYEKSSAKSTGLTLLKATSRRTRPVLLLLAGWVVPCVLRKCVLLLRRRRTAR